MYVNQSANRGGNVGNDKAVPHHDITEHCLLVNATGTHHAFIVAAREVGLVNVDRIDAIEDGAQYIVTYTMLDLT